MHKPPQTSAPKTKRFALVMDCHLLRWAAGQSHCWPCVFPWLTAVQTWPFSGLDVPLVSSLFVSLSVLPVSLGGPLSKDLFTLFSWELSFIFSQGFVGLRNMLGGAKT